MTSMSARSSPRQRGRRSVANALARGRAWAVRSGKDSVSNTSARGNKLAFPGRDHASDRRRHLRPQRDLALAAISESVCLLVGRSLRPDFADTCPLARARRRRIPHSRSFPQSSSLFKDIFLHIHIGWIKVAHAFVWFCRELL